MATLHPFSIKYVDFFENYSIFRIFLCMYRVFINTNQMRKSADFIFPRVFPFLFPKLLSQTDFDQQNLQSGGTALYVVLSILFPRSPYYL